MGMRRMAALPAGLLLVTIFANAAAKSAMRIKVLDSETRSVSLGTNGVPNDCDQVTFDAYCRSSGTPQLRITLLVQEGNQPPFRVACAVDTRWSRCVPLPKGETFDAKREKHGILVYYEDDKGKARSQLYRLVAGTIPLTADAGQAPPAPPSPSKPASQPAAASPSPAPAVSAPAAAVTTPAAPEIATSTVKCNFNSTPAGADITLDGKYVGSTPSEIAVSAGKHVVEFSMPGFAQWRRDLTVVAGSGVINVTAALQKTQP
jgi:hypothetical protein